VLSSPWARCVASVEAYAAAAHVPVRHEDALTEDGHHEDATAVSALVSGLLDARETVAVCTHRPVLGTLLGTLAGNVTPGGGDGIPRSDPFLEDAEVLVAHVSRRSSRVVAVERHVAA
jgi:phosphohistidine phosphatase SixA